MKIIHCADIHADSKMGAHYSKEQAEQRRTEIIDSFERMTEYAKENGVKAIIIAGDLFDSRETFQKKIKQRVAYIINKNPQIDFLYLRGNHDEDVIFPIDADYPNLKKFNKDSWTKYSYENVDIYGHEFGKNIPVNSFSELVVDSKRVNIVVMHGLTVDYRPKKEVAPEISLTLLENKNIDYVALGHIHSHAEGKLDSRGRWCYPGCLEGRGFDEAIGETGKKGFVVLDIQKDKIKTEFVSVASRSIYEIKVDVSDISDYEYSNAGDKKKDVSFFDKVIKKIETAISKNSEKITKEDIVRIVLIGEIDENTDLEPESYETALESGYYLFKVKDETQVKINYMNYENDISLKGEFIRLVKSQENLTEEEKIRVIVAGIRALYKRSKPV